MINKIPQEKAHQRDGQERAQSRQFCGAEDFVQMTEWPAALVHAPRKEDRQQQQRLGQRQRQELQERADNDIRL